MINDSFIFGFCSGLWLNVLMFQKNILTPYSSFQSRTVHLDTIKVLLPTDAQNNCFKRILKFTLKQLKHVSVLSPSSGSIQFELAKVTFVKTDH
jgi:hypothetical protein